MTDRLLGRIASIRYDQNFGFVAPEDPARRGEEVFFHASALGEVGADHNAILRTLQPGDLVTFEEMYTKKGLRAHHIRKEQP